MANGLDPYTLPVHVGQTLLWPVWLVISYVISGLVPFGSPFVYIGIIKLAPIAADLLLPFVVIKAIESLSGVGTSLQNKTRIVKLILLNPLLILASSFWAMTDSIAVLLILLSFIAVSKNRIVVKHIRCLELLSQTVSYSLCPTNRPCSYLETQKSSSCFSFFSFNGPHINRHCIWTIFHLSVEHQSLLWSIRVTIG